MKHFLARREEPWLFRLGRGIAGLLITGLVVEVALMPIALFHFHKAGLYGALANVVAIPLTTFVIMPFEALALLFDSVGLGAPFRSEEHTSELQSLMRTSYAVFCLK